MKEYNLFKRSVKRSEKLPDWKLGTKVSKKKVPTSKKDKEVKESVTLPSFKEFLLLERSGIESDDRFKDLPAKQQIVLKKKVQGMNPEDAEDALQQTWEKISGSKGHRMSKDDPKEDKKDDEEDNEY